jgi:glycerol-3-phosphate dehydrogenase
MVERLTDSVVERLGRAAGPPVSSDAPLVGGDLAPPTIDDAARSGARSSDRLADLDGSEAPDVRADGGDVEAEARQAVRREAALRLEDYWVRRSARAYFDLDAGLSTLEPASREMARMLGWSETRRESEVTACRARHVENNALFEDAAGTGSEQRSLRR